VSQEFFFPKPFTNPVAYAFFILLITQIVRLFRANDSRLLAAADIVTTTALGMLVLLWTFGSSVDIEFRERISLFTILQAGLVFGFVLNCVGLIRKWKQGSC